jgi:hypothetical protein
MKSRPWWHCGPDVNPQHYEAVAIGIDGKDGYGRDWGRMLLTFERACNLDFSNTAIFTLIKRR